MDAHAHLLALGWAGPGHSLDSRPHKGRRGLAYDPKAPPNTGNGLIKPLLISQKKNTFGIGKKAHEPPAGTEWWLKGFETALGNIGKSESERTSGTATPDHSRNASGYQGKHAGLYGFFVKGGEMEGTIGSDEEERHTSVVRKKKRKSDTLATNDDGEGPSNPSSEGDQQTHSKKKHKSEDRTAAEFEVVGTFLDARDKDEKRRQRKQRAAAAEEFAQAAEFFEARSARRKQQPDVEAESVHALAAEKEEEEDSEQERERRRRRKERKAAKRAKAALQGSWDKENNVSNDPPKAEGLEFLDADAAAVAKAARRAERKRRKELERQE